MCCTNSLNCSLETKVRFALMDSINQYQLNQMEKNKAKAIDGWGKCSVMCKCHV